MTRLRSLLALPVALLLAATVLAGCGDAAVSAATVNGVDLSDSDFKRELEVLRDHPEFAAAAFNTTVPEGDATVDTDIAATVLTVRVIIELLDQELDARGLEVDDEARADVDGTFTDQLRELLDELPEDYRDSFIEWNAQLLVLRSALAAEAEERAEETTDAEVEAFFADYGFLWGEQACASHVLLETEAEADDVVTDLEGGADFGEVAAERSIDPSAEVNGGDLGCAGEGVYVAPFEEAVWNGPIGEIQGPIESDFGFHVILVESRGEGDLADVESEIRAFLDSPQSRDGQQLLQLTIERLTRSADVSVNARYGSWDSSTSSVVAPEPISTGNG